MNRLLKIILVVFCFAFLPLNSFAQSIQRIENELVAIVEEIDKYSTYGGSYDEDKLDKANNEFEEKLLKYTKSAATLNYNFPKLADSIIIATSNDGKFRTYSWDEGTGGTMHDYAVVYQYQGANGKVHSRANEKKTAEDGGVGSFIYSIFPVTTKTGKVYVACSTFISSTSDHYGSAKLYKIVGGELTDKVKLFKTKEGLTDSISFEYDFFSVVDREERPIRLIRFDKSTQTVKIPIVIQDKKTPQGKVTDKFISYRFDGKYFVRVN